MITICDREDQRRGQFRTRFNTDSEEACHTRTPPPSPQANLQETVQRLCFAMETASLGMWDWTPETNTIYFDDGYYTIAGYTPGEFPATVDEWRARIHPEDLKRVREGLYRLARGEEEANENQFRFKTRSGGWMWILGRGRVFQRGAAGRPTRIIGTHIDITDLKAAESEKHRAQSLFEQVVMKSHAGILIAQDGIIRFVNPSLSTITGFAEHELTDRPMLELIHPTDQEMVLDRHVRRLRGEPMPDHYNFRSISKNGQELWLDLNAIVFEWQDRPATLCFIRDVTFNKAMEQQLLQTQKIQAIGTLAGGIAHDFNNIVSAIMGYTEICLMQAPKDSQSARRLGQILQASRRASGLVNQILAFSRQEEMDQRPVNLTIMIKEVMKLIRASVPSSIAFETQFEKDIGPVMADPTHIHQVVMNLCTNAVHAMDGSGGTLHVGLSACDVDDTGYTATLRGLIPGAYARLSVSDTGHGIDPAIVKKIFDPYFTTKRRGEGTGLGLSVVHGIVTQLGGSVTVYSEPEKGTTFHVYLPTIDVDEEHFQPTLQAPVSGGNETILLVDDDGVLLEMTHEMLEGLGYHVVSRSSSLEAIQAFSANPDRFDLIITDQTMPAVSGLELAGKIRLLGFNKPVILCSGFSADISQKRLDACGIRAVLKKPVLRRELAATIRRIMDKPSADQGTV